MLYNLALLLPCAVCLFSAAWLICKRESNTKAQNILVLCFLLSGVFFFCTANYIGGISDYATYRWVDILDCLVTPFTIPTMYLYFRALTSEEQFTWKDYIWFLPAFIIGISTCVLYLTMDEAQTASYITSVFIDRSPEFKFESSIYRLHHLFSIELYTLVALVQILGTVTCAIIYLKRYHNRLREFHSTLDYKSIDLDYVILYWFMLTIPFALCIILTNEPSWGKHPIITSLFFTGYAMVYFKIYYYGSQRRYTVENLAEDLQQADLEAIRNHYDLYKDEENRNDEPDTNETRDTSKYNKYLPAFNKLIEEEQIFLCNTLRADEMAAKMYTNRSYLSRMIKEEFQCTFSDYINQKRIEYAQKKMQENPDIKLSELADKSGFANINSFGRTFKQITGTPPKEWLKNNFSKV